MDYLNTNIPQRLFQDLLNDENFVDKSMLIEKISSNMNTKRKYICITRPRHFRKIVNVSLQIPNFELMEKYQEVLSRKSIMNA